METRLGEKQKKRKEKKEKTREKNAPDFSDFGFLFFIMSEQPAARVQAEAEDLRTPPPAYLEHPPATITPSALVQHETSEEPEIVGNTSVTQESLSAVPEKPLPTVPAEAYGGQTEYVHHLPNGVPLATPESARICC